MKLQRLSVLDIVAMKRRGERIAALTAYDYTSAQMVDAAGVPFILETPGSRDVDDGQIRLLKRLRPS